MDAARGDHVDVVEFLLGTWQADLFAEDVMGRRVLHHAAQAGSAEVIRCLVRKRVDVDRSASVNHISPLHYAAKVGMGVVYMHVVLLFVCFQTGSIRQPNVSG